MATQNPTTQTPPVIDMGISSFNTTGKATTTTPPIQPIEEKIKSGTATAQDFAAYNIQKGSNTAGSELLQQIKPTTTPAPKTIDMGISSFNVSQPTPPINSNPTTQIATLNPNNQGKTGFNYDAMVSGFGGNYMDGQGNLTGNKDDVYNKGLDYLKSKGASDTEINEWKNKVDSHFAGGKTDIELQKTTPTTTSPQPAPTPTTSTAPIQPKRAEGEELKPVTTTPAPKRELMAGETITPTKIDATSTDEQIKARQEQLYNNLNSLYSANDQQLKSIIDSGDYEKYISRFNTTNPDEKKIVDAFYQANQPKTIDAFFNILKSGQKIQLNSVLNNPQYKTAKDVFDDYSNMKNYNSEQFATVLKNGELIKNQTLYNELIKDPIIAANIAKAEKLNLINKTTTNTEAVTQNQTDAILSKNQTLKQALENNEIDDNEMKALLSSPEIDSLNKEVVDLKTKYDEVKAEYDDIENSIRNQYKGTGALEGYIQAKIGKAQKDIFKRLEVAQNTYNNKLGYLTDLKKEKADLLNVNLDLYKTQEERQYKADLLAEERKYQEGLANREFDLKYGDINSTDPRIQKVGFERMATQLQTQYAGMPFRRDIPTMANDFQTQYNSLISQGKTPSQALEAVTMDVTNAIQNSPSYTQWATEKGLIYQPKYSFTEFDNKLIRTDEKGNYSIIAEGTPKASEIKNWEKVGDYYQSPDGTLYSPGEINQLKVANNSYLNMDKGTYTGVECGQYARTATGLSSTPGGNSLDARKKAFSDTTPVPGGMVLFTGGGYDKTYGHIAVVTSVSPDGNTFTVKESNYNGDKKVTERTLTKEQIKKAGVSTQFYNNTPLAGGGDTNVGGDYMKILNTKLIAGASKLSDKEREYTIENMKSALSSGDNQYANEILRGIILNDKRLGDTIYDNNELKTGLQNLKGILQTYKQNGGNTGVLTSIAETVANYTGTTTNEQLAKANNQLGVLVADYIRAISGTAASDKEVARLVSNMPNIKNIDSFNTTILDNLENIANNKVKSGVETFLGNYKNIAPDLFPDVYKKATTNKSTQTKTTPTNENQKRIDYIKSKYKK